MTCDSRPDASHRVPAAPPSHARAAADRQASLRQATAPFAASPSTGIGERRPGRPVLQPGVARELRCTGNRLQVHRVLHADANQPCIGRHHQVGRSHQQWRNQSQHDHRHADQAPPAPPQAEPGDAEAVTASPHAGMCGTSNVAAGQAAVVRATYRIASTPHPMGTNASQSSPNGISSSAISPAGITQSAVSGTATMFATTK